MGSLSLPPSLGVPDGGEGGRGIAWLRPWRQKGATARVSPMGLATVELVRKAMTNPNPLTCRTGVPPCGKPTTGVTIRPWTGIFMLHGPSSPESYFQAAFRVQSP